MKAHIHSRVITCCIALLILAMSLFSGCKRGDIGIVTNSSLDNREETIGRAFNTCPLFTNVNWDRITNHDSHSVVVFTADLPADDLIREVSKDSGNWLPIEKHYFDSVSKEVEKANIKITFPIDTDSFSLQDIMLGISSSTKTVWSPALSDAEKKGVLDAIYEKNDRFLLLLAHYANPSFKNGSTLFYQLTGQRLTYSVE